MYRYVWKIKLKEPDKAEDFLNFWKETSEIIQKYPGALGTHAHMVRDEPGCYFLVAQWESQEARDAMSNDIHNSNNEQAKKWRSYPKNDSFGEVTSFAGEEIGSVTPE